MHYTSDDLKSRNRLLAAADRILAAQLRYATPEGSGLVLGPLGASFDERAAELEGFSRLLWAAAFCLDDLSEANRSALLRGMANGSDPAHPGYWGEPEDYDQRLVEMAAFGVLIMENPGLPDALGREAFARLCRWLATCQHRAMPANNWRFFRIIVMKALEKAGWEIDRGVLRDELEFIDAQYLGGGWYADDPARARDYYNPFGFHFYSLLYARWFAGEAAERARCVRWLARSRAFAERYAWWFDDDGAHVAYGRSLAYRFGPACFWPLLASFGDSEDGLTAAHMRGFWERSLSWWSTKRIFDDNGRITIGYAYPNQFMGEFYNSPQSPLWGLKAFFPVALSDRHAFWRTPSEAMTRSDGVLWDREGGFAVQRRQGGAYLAPGAPSANEQRAFEDKYCKFAYSSRHGFCVESLLWGGRGYVGDNVLAFQTGERRFGRTRIERAEFVDGGLKTIWRPFDGCTVETTQTFTADGERRTHVISSPAEVSYVATGHAVDCFHRGEPTPAPASGPAAEGRTLYSDIRDVAGTAERRVAAPAPNTNLIFPRSSVPALFGRIAAGRTVLDTVLSYGRRTPSDSP